MGTAIITITDDPAGGAQVTIALDFGEDGAQDTSSAHHMALAMIRSQTGGLSDDEEEGECGHG